MHENDNYRNFPYHRVWLSPGTYRTFDLFYIKLVLYSKLDFLSGGSCEEETRDSLSGLSYRSNKQPAINCWRYHSAILFGKVLMLEPYIAGSAVTTPFWNIMKFLSWDWSKYHEIQCWLYLKTFFFVFLIGVKSALQP